MDKETLFFGGKHKVALLDVQQKISPTFTSCNIKVMIE